MKKYEFTGETKVLFGVTLKRIRATVSFSGVVKGDVVKPAKPVEEK